MLPSPDARHERSKVLEAVDAALADPVRLMVIVAGSADEADAARRISQEWALDDEQTRAVMDLQVRRVTAAGRAIVADELRVLAGPSGARRSKGTRTSPGGAPPSWPSTAPSTRSGHGVCTASSTRSGSSPSSPSPFRGCALRKIRITGLPEGPTRMTCTPARHGSFEYPERQMAPTAGG